MDFICRREHAISKAIRKFSRTWSEQYLHRYYLFAGHVERMTRYDKTRLTSRVLEWRSVPQLHRLQKEHGSQLHGRHFRAWRWEQRLCAYPGVEWRALAHSKRGWHEAKRSFVERFQQPAWRKATSKKRPLSHISPTMLDNTLNTYHHIGTHSNDVADLDDTKLANLPKAKRQSY